MNPHDDKSLDDARLSELYRGAGDDLPPSPDLDRDILRAAACAGHLKAGKRSFWQRMQMPVSVSAALMVTVVLARWMPDLQNPDRQFPMPAAPVTGQGPPGPETKASGVPQEWESRAAGEPQSRAARDDAKAQAMEKLAVPATRAAKSRPQEPPVAASQSSAGPHTGAPVGEAEAEASQKLPTVWLEEIRRLVASGDTEQAARELHAFVEAYPRYPVDPSLKVLLETPPDH